MLILLWASVAAVTAVQVPFKAQSHSQDYKFDPLLHLPGISPYFDAVGSGLDHTAPLNCKVTAATYLIRHGAIYANNKDYDNYIKPFIQKVKHQKSGWTGPLKFLKKWETHIDEDLLEEITPQGKKEAKKVGKHLFSRYPSLVPTTKHIYADKKSRTQDTAKALAKAFDQHVKVRIIDTETSFHAQIPHKACPNFSKDPGDSELETFIEHYVPPIIQRLSQFSPVELSISDIIGMQQLCGYESAYNGKKSSFCDVFTDVEWMSYEYAWDMKYSFMVGHGNPLSPYLGFPFLNATSTLFNTLSASPSKQRFFLSFTHREVPPFIATALGLFNSSNAQVEEFPTDRVNWSRQWRMSELIPFLGHLGFELVECTDGKEYIRVLANSAPRPIPRCQGGPGASCPLVEFTKLVSDGMSQYGDLHSVCGNSSKYFSTTTT